jgi:hypothetical protein
MWLLQGLLANWLSAVLIVLGGIVIGYLKKNSSPWFGPTIWGFAGCGLVAVALLCFWGITSIPKNRPPDVTPENIERNIRTWLDDFSLSSKKQDLPDTIFVYVLTMPNGDPISIGRTKARDRYITLQAQITISPQHQDIFKKLSQDDMDELQAEISRELGQAKVSSTINWPSIFMADQIPLTSSLTEDEFMRHVDEMDDDVSLVRDTVLIRVAEYNKSLAGGKH